MNIMKMGENPNFLGSWDIENTPNKKIAVTIAKITDEEVVNAGQKEICTVFHFIEDYKPMIFNVTNKKRIARLLKTTDSENLIGKRFYIGIEKVKAFGQIWDALRVVPNQLPPSSEQPEPEIKCEICKNNITPCYGMTAEKFAEYTKSKFGKKICNECALKIKDNKSEVTGNENNENNH